MRPMIAVLCADAPRFTHAWRLGGACFLIALSVILPGSRALACPQCGLGVTLTPSTDQLVCPDKTIDFTANVTGGVGTISYYWCGGTIGTTAAQGGNVYSVGGEVCTQVWVTVKDGTTGCTATTPKVWDTADDAGLRIFNPGTGLDNPPSINQTPGALVVMNEGSAYNGDLDDPNNAPRVRIDLSAFLQTPTGYTTAILTWPTDKLKVFDAPTGGNEILENGTDNVWTYDRLTNPTTGIHTVYVQGVGYSSAMMDAPLTFAPQNDPSCDSTGVVNFTVLWVDMSANYGNVSANDTVGGLYKTMTFPAGSTALGPGLFSGSVNWMGSAVEYVGTVHPSGFNPSKWANTQFAGGPFSLTRYLVAKVTTPITVTDGGSGYTSAPTVTLTPPAGAFGEGATAQATITNGQVSAVTLTNAGRGYTKPPLVSFSGGGGTGAAATATLTAAGQAYEGQLDNTARVNPDDAPGNDTSDPEFIDVAPDANGVISAVYDIDAPGQPLNFFSPANFVYRLRDNWQEWANWGATRCSIRYDEYTRQSWILTGRQDGDFATGGDNFHIFDTNRNWPASVWDAVNIMAGPGDLPKDNGRRVENNTATVLPVTHTWDQTPTNQSEYDVGNRTTYTQNDKYPGDNTDGHGWTNTSKNLQ